jgi:hypothetical protein
VKNSKQKQILRRHEMKKRILWLLVLSLCLIGIANTYAATWDLGSSFTRHDPNNPIGVWSLGRSTALTQASFALNLAYEDSPWGDVAVWWSDAGDPYPGYAGNWPLIWYSFGYTENNILPGETQVQTGVTRPGENGVIRWTSPVTGYVEASVSLEYNYGASSYAFLQNDVVLGTLPAGNQSFSQILSVTAGDTLDLVVIPPDAGSHSVSVAITIEEVTEPTGPVECILQLDAGAGLTDPNTETPYGDGDVVVRWQDTQSGKNMQALRAWGDPTLETNEIDTDKNVVRFDGDDGLIVDPNTDPNSLLNATNYTIYVVGRINDLTLSQIFYANYSDPPAGAVVGISDTQFNTVKYYANYGGTMSSDFELAEGRFYLMKATRNWMGERTLSINGEVVASSSGKSTYNSNTVVSIGALDIGRQFLVGDIAEIRVYNGVDPDETVTDDLMTTYDIDTSPVISDPNIIFLTGMTLYQTSNSGDSLTTGQWNTAYPDAAWDLPIYEGDTLLTDPNELVNVVLNNQTYMMIDIPFELGQERIFTWYNVHSEEGPAPGSYFGISLFFDDGQNQNDPGIAAFAQMDSTGPGDGNPVFHAISINAGGWPYSASVPGPGLIYYDQAKNLKITLTNYVVYDSDLGIDVVPTQNAGEHPLDGPDGFTDMFGHFTLKVETLDCSTLDHFAADFNADCRVDLDDFAQLITDWLMCNDPANIDCPTP